MTTTGKSEMVRLQGVGARVGLKVAHFMPGSKMMFNYGAVYEVVSNKPVSPKYHSLVLRCVKSGTIYHARWKADTLKAIAS